MYIVTPQKNAGSLMALRSQMSPPDKGICPGLGSMIGDVTKVVLMAFLTLCFWHVESILYSHVHLPDVPRVHKYCSCP